MGGVLNGLPAVAFLSIGLAIILLLVGHKLAPRENPGSAPSGMTGMIPALGLMWMVSLERQWRSIFVAGAIALTAVVLRQLPLQGANDDYGVLALAWISATLLYLFAVSSKLEISFDWRAWWKEHQRLVIVMGIIMLAALFLRAWRIGSIPFVLSGDEGSQGLEAIRVIDGDLRNPFSTGWLGVPTMSFFFNSVSIRLVGRTVTALRLPWVLVGSITVLFAFLLVRRAKGTPLALMTAALLATYHYHIHFSRLGSNQIADPFFMPLALLFLYRAYDRENRLDWAMAGAVSGLALYFYAGARLTPLVVIVLLGYQFTRERGVFLRRHLQGIGIAAGAFLIMAAPMIQYAYRFPDDFNARLNQVGIIQSGWIGEAMAAQGESAAAVLFDQFQRAALAFNYYPDRTVWYGLREPLLNPLFGSLFLLGLGYGTLRLVGHRADTRLAPLVAWWWGGMLLGGMLTESPPSSQRLVTLAVPVCFFISLALWEIVQLADRGIRGVPKRAILASMAILFAGSSLATYFLDYTPQRIYGGPYAELATEIAPRLREISPGTRFYFVGAPWMYWGIATLPYLVPDADAVDVTGSIDEAVSQATELQKKNAVFIFIPQRMEELQRVREAFPEGRESGFYSPVDSHLMVTLYEVAP
jgi:hypothetical protein